MQESEKWKWSPSVVSDSLRPHGLQPSRLLHPWDFPVKSTGVGCPCLLNISQFILQGQHFPHTKPDKNTTRKQNYRTMFLMNTDEKILNKTLTNWIQQYIFTVIKWDLSLGANQQTWYITLIDWKVKTIYPSQYLIQKKVLIKLNVQTNSASTKWV